MINKDCVDEDSDVPVNTVVVVLSDRATQWIAAYSKASKTEHAVEAMQHFAGSKDITPRFYCDSAPELIASARACKWRLATASTGMPQTNGVAERSV